MARAIVHQNARIVAWLTDHRLPLLIPLAVVMVASFLTVRHGAVYVGQQANRHRLPLMVLLATAIAAAALWWAWPLPQSERLAGPDTHTERPFAGPDGRVP